MAWPAVAIPQYSEPSPTPTAPAAGVLAREYAPTSHSHSHTPSDSDASPTTLPPPWPTPEPSGPLCTFTNTVTYLEGRDQGCDFDPSNQPCFADGMCEFPGGCSPEEAMSLRALTDLMEM
ncbi:hypothetical protein E4U56_008159 [Claviceps arundinis]|uniref:Uncharacterized protein n=1 Tax=Claviceps arundinis TaxID=1623583 RepID=A0A9P7MZR9_9HYPO|nr:hypothetical protein E4U56_008159 [Claviceps arundinis]